MELGVGLMVSAGKNGEEGVEIFGERLLSEATSLPLPVLWLWGNIAITKRVFFGLPP